MYHRGGKVWIESDCNGFVFLEADWDHSRLPIDLVEEMGLVGVHFKQLPSMERAKLGGYCKSGEDLVFILESSDHIDSKRNGKALFVASEFSDWDAAAGNNSWRLNLDGDSHILRVPWKEFAGHGEFCFKFITEDGIWLNPPSDFPFVKETYPGATDYLFDPRRSGRDVFNFQILEQSDENLRHGWFEFRPKGKFGYFQEGGFGKFRIFAPRAEKVDLLIYDKPESSKQIRIAMNLQKDGSWVYQSKNKFEDCYYRYGIFHQERGKKGEWIEKIILDPYAKAAVGRDGPGLVTVPESHLNSSKCFSIPKMKDLVIVEVHIRDLLTNAPIDLSSDERLEFRGLSKWLQSPDCYLRKLGVNAVEIQPILEFDGNKKSEYHWGYMPVSFFAPASAYGSDPESGISISEFKELVKALHECGLAVILDVVYNHVGIPNHLLNLDRNLYFRTEDSGKLQNCSGCGNDLRCEAEPVKKLILDSLKYLVETFDLDGFRFDLGELMGFDLLEEIQEKMDILKPGILLIAEPWSFRGRLPTNLNCSNYSLWSDECREKVFRFVQGTGNKIDALNFLRGKLDLGKKYPWQSLNYLESHDDYSLVDRFCSIEEIKKGIEQQSIQKVKLALALLLLSPGVPMISAGQDLMRHKQGIRNTYRRGDLNKIDYSRFEKYRELAQDIRFLIKFRLSDQGEFLRPYDFGECQYQELDFANESCLGLKIFHSKSGNAYYLLANASPSYIEFSLPETNNGSLSVLKDGVFVEGAGLSGCLRPLSYLVFRSESFRK